MLTFVCNLQVQSIFFLNLEPENGGPLEEEIPFGSHNFQVPLLVFGGVYVLYVIQVFFFEFQCLNMRVFKTDPGS